MTPCFPPRLVFSQSPSRSVATMLVSAAAPLCLHLHCFSSHLHPFLPGPAFAPWSLLEQCLAWIQLLVFQTAEPRYPSTHPLIGCAGIQRQCYPFLNTSSKHLPFLKNTIRLFFPTQDLTRLCNHPQFNNSISKNHQDAASWESQHFPNMLSFLRASPPEPFLQSTLAL